jgi:iron complex outermembrane receptor protein
MFPIRTTEGEADVKFFDATISGTVMQLPAGPLNVAVGTDIRSNGYWMKSSDNVLRGELVGVFGLQVDDRVNQYAVFTEAMVPVTQALELTPRCAPTRPPVSTRTCRRSWACATPSPTTCCCAPPHRAASVRRTSSNPVTAWAAARSPPASSIRAAARPPTQLNDLVQKAAGATTADKAQANSFRAAECLANLPSFVSSNPDLEPETSRSLTAGIVFQPIKNWSMALDYYHIERKNEIGTRA